MGNEVCFLVYSDLTIKAIDLQTGFVFLGLAAKKFLENTKIENNLNTFLSVNESFDLNEFIHSGSYKLYGENFETDQNGITALFVITSVSCSVCISEIVKYNEYFNKNNILDKSVRQSVVFIEQNKKKALRLVKTTEFITPVLYGYDKEYAPFLLSFGAKTVKRQLLLIDNKSRKIFFRALLPISKPTDDSYRGKMIVVARKSLLRIYRNGN